jgi:N-acetylmuramoyl-L-alanine amidase
MKFLKNVIAIMLSGVAILLYLNIPIYVSAQTNTSENGIGYLDGPDSNKTISGTQNVWGWFLDESGVEKIEVLMDGAVVGQATYGDARPDVQQAFPQYNNGTSGFHYAIDTTQFSDGQHTVSIKVLKKNGHITTLPDSTIRIENTKGILDSPVSGSMLRGIQNVRGWFLDESGVAKIEVLVDGAVAGQATYGGARPDVQQAFSQYNNGTAGFHYVLDTTRFSDGQHIVSIKVTRKNGHITTLPDRTIKIENTIGILDAPDSGSTLRGTQNVRGWFLDESGDAKIEVLVDGAVAGQATYGDARPDVHEAFPQYNNGTAGFHYAIDTTQFLDGQHTVTIRVSRKNGHTVTLPDRTIAIENNIGILDSPVSGLTHRGTQNVRGWFLSPSGVAKIEVLVDGTLAGQANYGDARTDVHHAFPQYNNGNSGFHYALDTTHFSDGQHSVTIRVTGNNGNVTTLPDRTITIENTIGYLDSPLSGSTLRGNQYVHGWFLSPVGVAKIDVLVDGTLAGQANYGDARPDVHLAFPQYNNGNAGFHYALDTTRFSDGQHSVTIRVTGINGDVTTLPDRIVTIKQSKNVFIDPGHGGSDPGATAGGYQEANLNLAVAKKVQSLLLNLGYTVYMSRNSDTYLGLYDRPQMANDLNADLFISIHTNSTGGATTANGIESYYYEYNVNYPSKINGDMHNNPDRILKSKSLTEIIHKKMVVYTGSGDRGTDGDTFAVIREAAMPATLLEMGFINNTSEREKLVTDSYQNIIAQAIADGIDMYFAIY